MASGAGAPAVGDSDAHWYLTVDSDSDSDSEFTPIGRVPSPAERKVDGEALERQVDSVDTVYRRRARWSTDRSADVSGARRSAEGALLRRRARWDAATCGQRPGAELRTTLFCRLIRKACMYFSRPTVPDVLRFIADYYGAAEDGALELVAAKYLEKVLQSGDAAVHLDAVRAICQGRRSSSSTLLTELLVQREREQQASAAGECEERNAKRRRVD
eukprot:TRINITY_DN3479_c0_g1_i1.p1 TRINITY_DN3479_c0_g1~~TRINITY_DN3479_c0_g1_i1.p1  ORF type:complete len:216 (+),score=60.86 TRINITY_DN3479_c0_g1_i1:48-695(+)